MSTILIRGGRVLDPARHFDQVADILIEAGKIKQVGKVSVEGDETINAKNLWVVPGLIDMHVHLREPGQEQKETIASGAAAAVAGGFTSVACMANTTPPLDQEALAVFVRTRADEAGLANVFPIGAVTKGLKGEELAEFGALVRGGAVAFSDDGESLMNADLLRQALLYAKKFGKPVISHCQDAHLAAQGVMNEGEWSTRLGLKGIPSAAEDVMVARDLALAKATGARLHIAHVSTRGSVELIRRARAEGVAVTAEAAPHHLTLTEECLKNYDANFKMNPPLRTAQDIEAIITGLNDGTLDAIASDHAPHTFEEKEQELTQAPFGVIGLETTLPIILTELVGKNKVPMMTALKALTSASAHILGLSNKGTLAEGADADVTLIDPNVEWTVDATQFRSKARNTPFNGKRVKGKAITTIVGGKVYALSH